MSTESSALKEAITASQVERIKAMAQNIRYGSITLVFQDGILVQIDKSEKIKISKS